MPLIANEPQVGLSKTESPFTPKAQGRQKPPIVQFFEWLRTWSAEEETVSAIMLNRADLESYLLGK